MAAVTNLVRAATLQIDRQGETYSVDTKSVGYAAARTATGWYFGATPTVPPRSAAAAGVPDDPNILSVSPLAVFGPEFATVRDAASRAFQLAFGSQIDTGEERLRFVLNGKMNVRNMVRTAFRAAGASAAEVAT